MNELSWTTANDDGYTIYLARTSKGQYVLSSPRTDMGYFVVYCGDAGDKYPLDWEHLWPLDAAKAIAQKHWDQQQRIGRLRKLIGGNARIEVDANSRMKVEFDV